MKIQNRAKICLCISIVIMLVAVVMSLTGHGINYGIDFAGGLNLQYDMGSTYDKADVEEALKAQGIEEFVVSTVGSEGTAVQIRVPTLSDEDEVQNLQNGLETTLLEKYPNMDTDNATASYVGPVAGATLVRNAIFSVLIAAVLMLLVFFGGACCLFYTRRYFRPILEDIDHVTEIGGDEGQPFFEELLPLSAKLRVHEQWRESASACS